MGTREFVWGNPTILERIPFTGGGKDYSLSFHSRETRDKRRFEGPPGFNTDLPETQVSGHDTKCEFS